MPEKIWWGVKGAKHVGFSIIMTLMTFLVGERKQLSPVTLLEQCVEESHMDSQHRNKTRSTKYETR